jgi:hypothetical protein
VLSLPRDNISIAMTPSLHLVVKALSLANIDWP